MMKFNTNSIEKPSIYLTFDAEPFWANVTNRYERSAWDNFDCPESTYWAFRFVKYCELNKLPATIFIVGKWAERNKDFVRYIAKNKLFTIGSHSHWHEDLSSKTDYEFKQDVMTSKRTLEDITGSEVIRFRAPSFSITLEQLILLEDCGYKIDSSISLSSRIYGGGQRLNEITSNIITYPLDGMHLLNKNITVLGGGYLRILPANILRILSGRKLGNMIYLHPHDLPKTIMKFDKFTKFENLRKAIRVGDMFSKLDILSRNYKFENF